MLNEEGLPVFHHFATTDIVEYNELETDTLDKVKNSK